MSFSPKPPGGSAVLGLLCVECGAEHPDGPAPALCPACGGNLDFAYDYARLRASWSRDAVARDPERGIWRWLPLLPLAGRPDIPLVVGGTPLVAAPRLARSLGLAALHVKDDGRNPSASLKDRPSIVCVARALEGGFGTVACASSGNAASALATVAASIGLATVIFVPEAIPRPKLAQLLLHGARVFLVRGSYDAAFALSLSAIERFGWFSRNSGHNPVLAEGKKTAAFEIAEQLGWKTPDRVYVAVGDGCILGGLHKGFADLLALGWIDRMPRLFGVQAEGASPLAAAFRSGAARPEPVREVRTFAESIAVGTPADATKALRAVRDTGGAMLAVSDDAIRDAMRSLAREGGVFAEPSGAAGFAGLAQDSRDGSLGSGESAVVVVTGSGLKDIDSAMRLVTPPAPIDPDLDAVTRALGL